MKILFGLFFLFCLSACNSGNEKLSEDCAPVDRAENTAFIGYIECMGLEKGCTKFEQAQGLPVYLKNVTRLPLKVSEAKVIEHDQYRFALNLQLEKSSACLFYQDTKRNIGKRLAIVHGGRVILAPVINEPISSGLLQISIGTTEKDPRAKAQEICQSLGKVCKS